MAGTALASAARLNYCDAITSNGLIGTERAAGGINCSVGVDDRQMVARGSARAANADCGGCGAVAAAATSMSVAVTGEDARLPRLMPCGRCTGFSLSSDLQAQV